MNIGDLVTFSYPAVHKQGTRAHDKNPTVLVLHNNWKGQLHGLNFNYLTEHEINMIRMILDVNFEKRYKASLTRRAPHVVKEYDSIMSAASASNITSPLSFYQQIIRPLIVTRSWDPYRRYRLDKITGARVLQTRPVLTGEQQVGNIFSRFADKFRFFRGPRI